MLAIGLLLGTVVAFSIYTSQVRRIAGGVDPLAVAALTQVGAVILVLPACLIDVADRGMVRGAITPEALAGPNNLTFSENSLRQASHYAEEAPDPKKNCTGCGFFTPGENASPCGKCEIFLGPVNARAHCDSWAEKKA